ncbi:MAG TPA: sigma-70 family RNA polymerase sigma factor [Solirubrobacterales bacterium]|nr:sigma-70 family RNA polymerase sigma factor [Solirubrobacterales bacterium]
MDRFSSYTDAELLERTARDPRAFESFYCRHEGLVVGFLMSRTRNAELTADLTAETFAALLEAADRFDPTRLGGTSAVPWILAVARYTLRASIRRGVVADEARRRLECEPIVLDDAALERVEELASQDLRLAELLNELPVDLRDAVTARVLDQSAYPEIAAKLRCSELVARKRVSRGLMRLRAAFASSSNP